MDQPPAMDLATGRAIGALMGLAIGDAMGMPSQTLSRAEIAVTYGWIDDFRDAAADQPVSRGLRAGTITDDTEQSLLLARHLVERNGGFDEQVWARTLLDWEEDTRRRGVHDLLGPSTKRAIGLLLDGVPASETGRGGTTNGAAMRIVPVGIATPAEPLGRLVDRVEETCRLTHNTAVAIASAAAVAAVVSAGVDGAAFAEGLPLALAAAREGQRRGTPAGPHEPGTQDMAQQIAAALAAADGQQGAEAAVRLASRFGTSVAAIESIPMAFAVVRLAGHDPWQAAVLGANIGDDTDTIGAIACAMAGACAGIAAIPPDKTALVSSVNGLDPVPLAAALLALRARQQRAGTDRLAAS